jgi:hypothetical protein
MLDTKHHYKTEGVMTGGTFQITQGECKFNE